MNNDVSTIEKKISELKIKKEKFKNLKEEIDVTDKLNTIDKEIKKLTIKLNSKQKED